MQYLPEFPTKFDTIGQFKKMKYLNVYIETIKCISLIIELNILKTGLIK